MRYFFGITNRIQRHVFIYCILITERLIISEQTCMYNISDSVSGWLWYPALCNRNTLKLSYSCMSNIEARIKAHNSKIINSDSNRKPDTCNSRKKEECLLSGQCTAANIIYLATVDTQNTKKNYIGLCATPFKTRYASTKASFNHEAKSNSTELSKHIWGLKQEGTPYTLKMTILRCSQPYSPASKRCNLCLWEKYHIITTDRKTTLNSRTELVSTCTHKKFLLSE